MTHPPAGDKVRIFVGLPLKGWNGRFQGVGGGGFSGGNPNGVRQPVAAGYAAASTDTGHEGGSGSFALDASGRLNWHLIRDNAHLGIHEMTITGKALTQEFYGKPARYAYFNGCSTGGRQGLMEAQRYPPTTTASCRVRPRSTGRSSTSSRCGAISSCSPRRTSLRSASSMRRSRLRSPRATRSTPSRTACSKIRGAARTIRRRSWESRRRDAAPISSADADVIRKIWEGPRRRDGSFLWYGLPRGAGFALSATAGTPPAGRPNGIPLDWFRYFLTQDPKWDWTTLTHESYEQLWDQSVEQFNAVIGTDNPDLSAFRDRGGKLIAWHGWADPLIYAEGTIDYFNRVLKQMGGAEKTAPFIRLFMAPGVGHCAGGAGPNPTGQFDAVVRWVEEGKPPVTLDAVSRDPAGKVIRSRPLCQYPLVARYKGRGSTDEAANFECRAGS